MTVQRSPLQVTFSVWKALFLREALTRLFASRGAWFWLFAEPLFHIAFLMFIFGVIRVGVIGGIDTMVWVMLGLLGFFMFMRTGTQVSQALTANKALFAYRQVKPSDPALVRGALEAFLLILMAALLTAGMGLAGKMSWPDQPLRLIGGFAGLWVLGMGYGLVLSVCVDLLPELGRIIRILSMPLYILSGVIFPIGYLAQPYRDWLLVNPIAHGLEEIRSAYADHYVAVPELDPAYMHVFALTLVFLGLALHARFADRLAAA
jgi:capsular polysaccharide transport system permease protein